MQLMVQKSAIISACGGFRYRRLREGSAELPKICFIMLNPSTADETTDDPTVRRCIRLAQRWDYGSLEAVNLFSYRSVSPSNLLTSPGKKVGELCDEHLLEEARAAKTIIAAWGSIHPALRIRSASVSTQLLSNSLEIYCLGRNRDSSPKRPLYVPAGTTLDRYD